MFDNVLLEYGGLPKIFPLAVHMELLGTPSGHSGVSLQVSGILIIVQPAMLMMLSMSWTMNMLNSLKSLPLMFPSVLGDYMAPSMMGEDPGIFLGL